MRNYRESVLVEQTQCPLCKAEGRDNSWNNLAVYDDGHSYCYSGHGIITGNRTKLPSIDNNITEDNNSPPKIVLPSDVDINYPHNAIEWVGQYGITRNDLLSNNVLWSESRKRLIFPIYGQDELIAFQGRYFGDDPEESKKKWFGKGNLKDTFNIIGKGDSLVLVEDIVSAIKVSKVTQAMPLYGSYIGYERFKRISKLIPQSTEVLIWLDPDKRSDSVTESRRGMMCGLTTRVIFSSKDPKEHSFEEIKEIIK